MSLTTTPGIYRVSHWTTVAVATVEYLDFLLVTYKNQNPVECPKTAIRALRGFLASAIEAIIEERPRNPGASINDYLILKEVLREQGSHKTIYEEAWTLASYDSFLSLLESPHTRETLSRRTMINVRIFLRGLQDKGELESYDTRMRRSHPWNHPSKTI